MDVQHLLVALDAFKLPARDPLGQTEIDSEIEEDLESILEETYRALNSGSEDSETDSDLDQEPVTYVPTQKEMDKCHALMQTYRDYYYKIAPKYYKPGCLQKRWTCVMLSGLSVTVLLTKFLKW